VAPENGRRPPPRNAGSDLPEQLPGELDPNITPLGGAAPARDATKAAGDVVAFDVLTEAAGVAINCAEALEDAAMSGDRARARLWACMLSRAARSALLTVADLFAEPRRAA
jgi:hypothetical protein